MKKSKESTDSWDLESLQHAHAAGKKLTWLHFWGHTAPADGSVGPHVLSQWWPQKFDYDGCSYATAEHYMMAGKARLFDDGEMLAEIMNAGSPAQAKAFGRKVQGFDQQVWKEHRFEIVVRGSIAKFSSSDELKNYLLATKNRVLVEASPRDRIWGIGMGKNNPAATIPSQWRGANLLGFALMKARAVLSAD